MNAHPESADEIRSNSAKRADESNIEDEQLPPNVQLPKIISFDTLARCGEEIWIENNGQIYRLRRTKQGKLILTK
ncbi:MAG: hemin uptake protein HemP [Planctomycetota bacterium]